MPLFRVHAGVVAERFDYTREQMSNRAHPDFVAALVDLPDDTPLNSLYINGEVLPQPPAAGRGSSQPEPIQQPSTDYARLSLLVGLANAAIARGVQAGDLHWLSQNEPFSYDGIPMDAQQLIDYAASAMI